MFTELELLYILPLTELATIYFAVYGADAVFHRAGACSVAV
jgi:hypothetical protein